MCMRLGCRTASLKDREALLQGSERLRHEQGNLCVEEEMTKHYGVGEVDRQQRANDIIGKYG